MKVHNFKTCCFNVLVKTLKSWWFLLSTLNLASIDNTNLPFIPSYQLCIECIINRQHTDECMPGILSGNQTILHLSSLGVSCTISFQVELLSVLTSLYIWFVVHPTNPTLCSPATLLVRLSIRKIHNLFLGYLLFYYIFFFFYFWLGNFSEKTFKE